MSSSLRKKLSNRQAKGKLRGPDSSDDGASSASTSRASTPSNEADEPIPFDDLSRTPPPPAAIAECINKGSIRRISPSSFSIHRYKARAPAAVGPSLASSMAKQDQLNAPPPKTTAFSEDFADDSTPPASAPATEPATPEFEKEVPGTVEGANYHLLTSSHSKTNRKRSRSAEVLNNTITKDGEQLLGINTPEPRRTRSQARREQRADSGAAGMGPDITNKKRTGESEKYVTTIPRGLSIRKLNQLPGTPSPPEADPVTHSSRGTTPTNSPNRSHSLPFRPLIDFCKSGGSLQHESALPSPKDVTRAISPDPLRVSPRNTPSPNRQASRIANEEYESDAILVNPPRYDPTKMIAYQWTGTVDSSSRPEVPWGSIKRWTCCHCHAQTIVEQRDCARLGCGHARCSTTCKVVKFGGGLARLYD